MTIINCDMGEAFGLYKMGDDEGLMPEIDVANVVVRLAHDDDSTARCSDVALHDKARFIRRLPSALCGKAADPECPSVR